VALASSGFGIGPDTPFDIFIAVFFIFIAFIALYYYYENKKKDKKKGETLANHSQEPKAAFDREAFIRDFVFEKPLANVVDVDGDGLTYHVLICETQLIVMCYLAPDLYKPFVGDLVEIHYNYGSFHYEIIQNLLDDDSLRERAFQEMDNFLRDFVFDKPVANVVDVDGDGLTYHVRICNTNLIVMCYLGPGLNKPFVGDLVNIHYNHGSLHYEINYLHKFTDFQKESGRPWAYDFLIGEIVDELEWDGEIYFYANLEIGQSLENVEPQHIVPCKPCAFLKNELIMSGDIVYLEANQRDRSFTIFYIERVGY
jgi:hypothetical protein